LKEHEVELGAIVRDRITGYEGVAIGKTHWLTGCATVGIQAAAEKEGDGPRKIQAPEWFDVGRVEHVGAGPGIDDPAEYSQPAEKGGPQPTPAGTRVQ